MNEITQYSDSTFNVLTYIQLFVNNNSYAGEYEGEYEGEYVNQPPVTRENDTSIAGISYYTTLILPYDDEIGEENNNIQQLKQVRLYKYLKNPNYTQCSICLEDFKPEEQVQETTCKHIFHKDCISTWTKNKKSCPCCRAKFSN